MSVPTSNRFTMAWIPPIIAYCTASILMTVINKLVMSGFDFKVPFLLLAVQALFSVVLLEIFTLLGWTKHRPLNKPDVKRWFPIAILMAVMLYTGTKALQYLSVPIFTIFKNLSIILVAYGETRVFGGKVTSLMLVSFILMVLSSVIAAQSDLSTGSKTKKSNTILGMIWMSTNCVSSAAFVIFMRYVIRKTAAQGQFRDFDTVFYNNILTLPLYVLLSLLGGDGDLASCITFYSIHAEERNKFVGALVVSGVAAFWISYASSWCMRVTNSTTYSMVGALNKLPIAISGLIFFKDTEITVGSVGSIFLGFVSGIIYTIAKLRYDQEQRAKMSSSSAGLLGAQASSSSSSSVPGGRSDSETAGFLNKYDLGKGFDRAGSGSSESVSIVMQPMGGMKHKD